jgi:hypothetical protein
VKLPGTDQYVELAPGTLLPTGTVVDLTGGAGIELTDAAGNEMTFSGGTGGVPSAFIVTGFVAADRITSSVGAAALIENLRLVGGDFSACKKQSLRTASAKIPPPVRQLFGKGKGRYRTRGNYASATVVGTAWDIEDSCTGTLVAVGQGSVVVRNLSTKKERMVGAHHSLFVPAPARKP